MTIFKLIRPRLERYLAEQIAGYLQNRRQQHLQANTERPPDCPPCPQPEAVDAGVSILSDPRNTFWFTLSGLILGGAFGMMTYLFMQDSRSSTS